MELLIGFVFLGASLAVALVLPVLSYLRATRASSRVDALARELQQLRGELAALRDLQTPPVADHAAPPPDAAREAWVAEVREMAATRATAPPDGIAPTPVDRAEVALDAPGAVEDASVVEALPPAMPPGPPPAPSVHDVEGIEERIGARWLLYAGIGSLILGASYFIKFAFDNGWVSEPLRVAIGLLAGGALVAGGQHFVQRGLAFFGHALSGGGLVVLYVALYAALHVYGLIEPGTAFGAMVGVTALGVWLADRHRVEVLGALAVAGGFLTPALVGGRDDHQYVLFLYLGLLLVGVVVLVVRHLWTSVAVLGYGLTVLTITGWVAAHYRPAAGLRTLLLLTPLLALIALLIVVLRRGRARNVLAAPTSWLLLTAPVLYHAAALWMVGRLPGVWLVYLLLATVAGLSASYHAAARWPRVVVLALVGIPFVDWLESLVTPRWYVAALVTTAALYLLHLAAQWRELSDDDPSAPLPASEVVHLHATGLFLPLALYSFLAPRASWWIAPMLTGVAAWHLGLAALLRPRLPALAWHALALAATVAAVAVSQWFDGPLVAVGWAIEGAMLGWAAARTGTPWLQRGALTLVSLGAMRLVDSLVAPMPVGTWPVVNVRTLATALVVGAMAWLALRTSEEGAPATPGLARHVLVLAAHVLVIGWLSAEIVHVFGERAFASVADGRPAGAARAELGEQVALSVAWALYAVGLVAAGFRQAYAPARYLAIALFGLTLVKVLTKDIAELDRVYQMLSVLGVGVLLVAASYLYQRTQTQRREGGPAA